MTNAFQSRRRIIALVAMLIVLVVAFILLRPRLWVKNKTAKVIVDGQLSEDVKLFHGSDDRLLFYLGEASSPDVYEYSRGNLFLCEPSAFLSLKLIALSVKPDLSRCTGNSNADINGVNKGSQSLKFVFREKNIVVSWQAAPR